MKVVIGISANFNKFYDFSEQFKKPVFTKNFVKQKLSLFKFI